MHQLWTAGGATLSVHMFTYTCVRNRLSVFFVLVLACVRDVVSMFFCVLVCVDLYVCLCTWITQ